MLPDSVAVDDLLLISMSQRWHYVSFEKADGRFVRRFGAEGSGQGEFEHLNGVALDGGHVYVADCDNNLVQVWTKAGVFVGIIGSGEGNRLEQPIDVPGPRVCVL